MSDIVGVLLVFREWNLASLPDQVEAHLSQIQFFKKLKGRFDPEDRASHIKEVLRRERALAPIMAKAYETTYRLDERQRVMFRGMLLIGVGFCLQLMGTLFSGLAGSNSSSPAWPSFNLEHPTLIAAVLGTCACLSLPLISNVWMTRVGQQRFDKMFDGVWCSTGGTDFLRLHLIVSGGSIIGLMDSCEVDDEELPRVRSFPRYYEVTGRVEGENAMLDITELDGVEPYPHATAEIRASGGDNHFIWVLLDDGIGHLPCGGELVKEDMY